MRRKFRLTRSEDFEGARRSGKSFPHRLLVLVAYRTESDQARVGVAAGRMVGNAVKRNRAKRLLRAGMHDLAEQIKPGWDVVLIARPPLAASSAAEVHEALVSLLRRAGLVSVS